MDSEKYYDGIAEGYDELHNEEQLNKMREIINALGHDLPDAKDGLLDVGCGTGISTSVWQCECTGIDPSEKLLAIARKKYPHIKFILGNSENLPFPDKSFDFVLSVTAVQNFDDIGRGIDEMKRVGKGMFAITALRKSAKIDEIEKKILKSFRIKKIIMEEKDIIFICSQQAL